MINNIVPLWFTLNWLLFISAALAAVTIEPLCDDKTVVCTVKYKIKDPLKLRCNITSDDSVEVTWEKDGVPVTEIKEMSKRIKATKEAGIYTLHVTRATQEDGGNYSCVAKDEDGERRGGLVAASKLYISTPDNLNVVEGERLRITCLVIGNPLPEISWIVHDELYESSQNRVKIMDDSEKKLHNAVLVIDQIELGDRGEYKCKAYVAATNQTEIDTTMVRIKDKYAALWPFLGICGEVFILCAIILVYEKKRNKTELEESDTDQSPEQKNTPDHGGKESNVRHRQ